MSASKRSYAVLRAGLLAGGVALAASAATSRAPAEEPSLAGFVLPEPRIPSDDRLLAQLESAVAFRAREDFARQLDAEHPGDLLEDATLRQAALRRGIFGNDALFVAGDDLFEYEFRPRDGLGNALEGFELAGAEPAPNLRRVHAGDFGGPDAHSCATCHFKGGPDGAGTSTQNAYLRSDGDSTRAADERNPPHLLGLGPIAALGVEMSAALAAQREAALLEAEVRDEPVEIALETHGVRFGTLTARPGGAVDASAVEGVDPDLVVRPFGWKGHATLREMVEESFRIHLGIVPMSAQERVRDGAVGSDLYGDGAWEDLDRDGVGLEVDDGMVTTLVAYLAQLPVPIAAPPQTPGLLDAHARGRGLFEEVGCARCHVPVLLLRDPIFVTRPSQPSNAADADVAIDVAREGLPPKLAPLDLAEREFAVELFSDLKRHDLGEALATTTIQAGIAPSVFLTRPLWGLAETAPYLHDGRAPTLDDAIRLHGGEAQDARDAYLELSAEDRSALRVFLASLSRTPELFLP